MKVVFDAFELSPVAGKSRGIYNYAKNLFQALVAAEESGIEWVVLCNASCAADFQAKGTKAGRVDVRVLHDGVPGRVSRQMWQRFRAALEVRHARADIYFSPKGFLPNGLGLIVPRARSVVVIHDLIPLWYHDHFPGHFGRMEEFVVNRALVRSALEADRVIAISHATATDIKDRLGRAAGVDVVHNGVPECEPGKLPVPAPFIFAVTSRFPHKNARGILEAYARYREVSENPLPLVVCGLEGDEAPGVHWITGITDAEVHACYAGASVFLFLSLIEGFGFPPVEAMRHGTPVVCSDIASLREVTRGAATYVSPHDPAAVASALCDVLQAGPPDREVIASAVAGYTWPDCASGVLEALRAVGPARVPA
jgi:glycosyltransferase involved in cell wall biosynthesis